MRCSFEKDLEEGSKLGRGMSYVPTRDGSCEVEGVNELLIGQNLLRRRLVEARRRLVEARRGGVFEAARRQC